MAAIYFQMVKQQQKIYTHRQGDIKQIWLNAHVGGRSVATFFQLSHLFKHFPTIKLGKTSQKLVNCQLTTKNYKLSDVRLKFYISLLILDTRR